jgi:hypothetical protein
LANCKRTQDFSCRHYDVAVFIRTTSWRWIALLNAEQAITSRTVLLFGAFFCWTSGDDGALLWGPDLSSGPAPRLCRYGACGGAALLRRHRRSPCQNQIRVSQNGRHHTLFAAQQQKRMWPRRRQQKGRGPPTAVTLPWSRKPLAAVQGKGAAPIFGLWPGLLAADSLMPSQGELRNDIPTSSRKEECQEARVAKKDASFWPSNGTVGRP